MDTKSKSEKIERHKIKDLDSLSNSELRPVDSMHWQGSREVTVHYVPAVPKPSQLSHNFPLHNFSGAKYPMAPGIPSFPSACSQDTSSSPSGWARHVRNRTLAAQRAMVKRLHPYDPKRTATPLELRFTTRALGHASHTGLTLEDTIKGKEHFQAALHAMPDRIVRKAYQAKLAARESMANRLQLTLSELESLERLKDYLEAVKEEQDAELAICSAHLDSVASVMEARGLLNVEDDGEFYRAAYADDLIALSISNAQVSQAREAMLSRPEPYPVPADGDQDLSKGVDEEDEELVGDLTPVLPSSKLSEVDPIYITPPS